MQIDKYLFNEVLVTLNHARVFISSRERMHKDGIALYDELVDKLNRAKEQAPKKCADCGTELKVDRIEWCPKCFPDWLAERVS